VTGLAREEAEGPMSEAPAQRVRARFERAEKTK